MAGDWIKMRVDLYRDPKVCALADMLIDPEGDLACYVNQNMQRDMCVTRNVMRNVAVGALLSVWGVMRTRGKRVDDNLVCRGVTPTVIDDIAEVQGFGNAMLAVGWVEEIDGSIVFPRFFEEHNVDPAESARQKNADRQRRHRDKKLAEKSNVTDNVTVTHREEKRREDIEPIGSIPPYPQDLDLPSWQRWVDYRKQIKKPIKPASAPAAMKSLASYGANQSAVVEQSIANGWQGLFALKAGSTVVNKQVAIEQRNRAVAEEWLAGEAHEAL